MWRLFQFFNPSTNHLIASKCKNIKLEEDCRNYYNNISSTQSPPDPMTHVKFKPFSHLGTTFMGFSWNHVDTEGILLPRTPPLCRVNMCPTQIMQSWKLCQKATDILFLQRMGWDVTSICRCCSYCDKMQNLVRDGQFPRRLEFWFRLRGGRPDWWDETVFVCGNST